MTGWDGRTFAEVDEENDRADAYEQARYEQFWADRETAADREIDAIASAALLTHPDDERVEITISGERLWVVRTGPDEYVIRTEDELRTEGQER